MANIDVLTLSPSKPQAGDYMVGVRGGSVVGVYHGTAPTATAAPTTGAYIRGEIVWNSLATVGGYAGWVCVAAGTPGSWAPFGLIPAPTPIDAQAEINAASSGAILDMSNRTYTGQLTINKPLTVIGLAITSTTNQAVVTVTASDVTLRGLTIQGPQGTTYNEAAIAINAFGTSASRIFRLKVQNCTISDFGNSGISTKFVNDAEITGNIIEDIVYDGIMMLSATGGLVQNNTIRRIGVVGSGANSGNAYGVAITNGGGEPRSQDVLVNGNLVEDVPTWQGLDTHGGLRITFSNNTVRGCWRAVFLTWGGQTNNDCVVTGNRLEAPAVNDRWAVQCVSSVNASITNNNMIGWDNGTDVLQVSSSGTTISGNYESP